jgi:hypothetical protein
MFSGVTTYPNLHYLTPEQLRVMPAQLIQRVETMDKQITHHKSSRESDPRNRAPQAAGLPSAASS